MAINSFFSLSTFIIVINESSGYSLSATTNQKSDYHRLYLPYIDYSYYFAFKLQVSKDIKYADKQPIVPWGPRFVYASSCDC